MKHINNRKARYNYYIEERFHAGISLSGSEVKSLRGGHCNLNEAFCYFRNGELFLKNATIVSFNNKMFSHDETRDRKLLLTAKELHSIQKKVAIKGYSIVPLDIEIPDAGFIKVNIAVCKGKHNYDKRNAIKERDAKRDIDVR